MARIVTGSRRIVANVWTDAAREAAIAARSKRGNFENAASELLYSDTKRAAVKVGQRADTNGSESSHTGAARLHATAARLAPDEGKKKYHTQESSRHSQKADEIRRRTLTGG